MSVPTVVKSIDKFFKDLGMKTKNEVDASGNIVITGRGNVTLTGLGDNKYQKDIDQCVFTIDKGGVVDISLMITKLYVEIKELAKKINGRVFINGRVVDDFRTIHTIPTSTETPVPPPVQPNIKSEMDPKGFESDERFLDVVSKIKLKMQSEMPIMAAEVIEQIGDDIDDDMKEKLKQAVYATATTTSMMTIRFLMETINEVMGEK